jgi:hypothetical protein
MSVRRNEAGPVPLFDHFVGNQPRVVGNEPFPGAMRSVRKFCRAGRYADPHTSIETDWPKRLADMISAKHLMDLLRLHFALAHSAVITRGRWSEADKLRWSHMPKTKKVEWLEQHHAFRGKVSDRCIIYTELIMAGETFGCALSTRSSSSSFVGLWSPGPKSGTEHEVHLNRLKYAQVQFYLTMNFGGVQHYFAVVRYYDLNDPGYFEDGLNDVDEAFPIFDLQHKLDDAYNLVPVQTICFRWIPCYRPIATMRARGRAFYQICPVPTKIHA